MNKRATICITLEEFEYLKECESELKDIKDDIAKMLGVDAL